MSATASVLGPIALAAALCGCGAGGPESKSGSLGHGTFHYDCVDHTDAYCPDALTDPNRPFPGAIALGAHFQLTYSSDVGQPSGATVVAVSPDFVVSDGLSFGVVRAGDPSFVAQLANGRVLDFTTVHVVAIPRIDVSDTTSGPSADVAGTTHTFTAIARPSIGSAALAGAVAYVWSSSDATILAPKSNAPSTTMQVDLKQAGTATLTAASGASTGSVTITVVGP